MNKATGRTFSRPQEVEGLVINFRDITEKVPTGAVLKEQEERLRTIVENASGRVVIFDETTTSC